MYQPQARPSRGHRLVRALFLREMGAIYLIVFTSLGRQVLGLYGRHGILPAAEFLEGIRSAVPTGRFRQFPTLLWLDSSDRALSLHCKAGRVAAIGLLLDVAPRASALTAWALYLSLVTVGQEFLSYQWDVLLLEAGLLTVLVAPPGIAPGIRALPLSAPAMALMRWLVFRLYLESGLVKLRSGDPTWRSVSACCYHYATQPLPNRVAWYAHNLPRPIQRLSTAAALAVEIAVPFFVLGSRGARRIAFWLFSGLQGAFALTGNFGFFNFLSFVLGVWLIDDAALAPVFGRARPRRRSRAPRWRTVIDALAAAPLFAVSLAKLARRFARSPRVVRATRAVARPLGSVEAAIAPFFAVNSYGLFAVMTTRRPEIVVEGSRDGMTWREYPFRYKPGAPSQAPLQVAPHQPRLDWQLWFAALGPPPDWFMAFLIRLLEGSPDVLDLLKENPFPDEPPRYVRAWLYEYRMTSVETKRRTGEWWDRELLGLYFPPVALSRARRSPHERGSPQPARV